MTSAASANATLDQLVPLLFGGDTVVDGGTPICPDDIRRSKELATRRRGGPATSGADRCANAGRAGLSPPRPIRCGAFREGGPHGIEHGLMASNAEGLNILRHAGPVSSTRR